MKKKIRITAVIAVIGFAMTALFMTGCSKKGSDSAGSNGAASKSKVKIEMVSVPGGSFEMGKDLGVDAQGDETPVHTVTLSDFKMSKYPVTQEQYQKVMGDNPSYFNGETGKEAVDGEKQEKRPVEQVSWYDAIVFCNKLSVAEGLTPAYRISGSTNPSDWGDVPRRDRDPAWDAVEIVGGSKGYRLPTEAQWEYAAKGGKGSPGNNTYAGSNLAREVPWYGDNDGGKTHEVGKKAPNGLGLYDMSGNVWEWCWDWYGKYSSDAQTDPTGAVSGSSMWYAKGYWYDSAEDYRYFYGTYIFPFFRENNIGFRLVRP